MSTEHDIDALEYGPTPAGAQYEHTDISQSVTEKFTVSAYTSRPPPERIESLRARAGSPVWSCSRDHFSSRWLMPIHAAK